jgi:hypothetical protein
MVEHGLISTVCIRMVEHGLISTVCIRMVEHGLISTVCIRSTQYAVLLRRIPPIGGWRSSARSSVRPSPLLARSSSHATARSGAMLVQCMLILVQCSLVQSIFRQCTNYSHLLLFYSTTVLLYYCSTLLLFYSTTVLLYYCSTLPLFYSTTVLLSPGPSAPGSATRTPTP